MSKTTETRTHADELGIKYHHNANDVTIQKLIDASEAAQADPNKMADGVLSKEECIPMSAEEYNLKSGKTAQSKRQECARLIRVRIQNMNPAKKDWPGEILSTGSAKLGTFKKYVPYDSAEPYHVPKILFDMMSEKKCTVFYTMKDERGNKIRKGRLVSEFALEVLDPLTADELSDLARTQALQAGQQ
jgi:hypothetical protein